MLRLTRIGEKRGLSNVIAYVLLISITLSLSVVVYGWLKNYTNNQDVDSCPDNVNVVISNYGCEDGVGGYLNVSVKNKGLFNVDGYVLRVHDVVDAEFGFYSFNSTGIFLAPGEEVEYIYDFDDYDFDGYKLTKATLVEVQPFVMEGTKKLNCRSSASQKVDCS
ncbi:hypothetical protein HN903_00875 [archaeon]|nr:hypothetical protein [archaeon]MBT6955840.1 hypothetical protein [archaeon]MBT7128284.1 hypothetical protein [archaeon]